MYTENFSQNYILFSNSSNSDHNLGLDLISFSAEVWLLTVPCGTNALIGY